MFRHLLRALGTSVAFILAAAAVDPECTFEKCPVCLPEARNQSLNQNLSFYLDGSMWSLPLRIGRCLEYWDMQALLAQLVGILAQEMLGINIEYMHAADELQYFLSINNCRNWMKVGCEKVVRNMSEASDAHAAGQKKFVDAAPDIMWASDFGVEACCREDLFNATAIVWLAKDSRVFGPTGYVSANEFYLYKETSALSWTNERFSLDTWIAYTVPESSKYFTSVQAMLDHGSIVHEIPCCDGTCPESTKHSWDLMKKLVGFGYTCTDGWWLTPACAALGNWKLECIPILDDGWGYWKPDVYEGMAKSGMRLAKATVGYDLFWELVYYQTFNVPFFWWSTDSQFTALKPVSIRLPKTAATKAQGLLETVGWQPVLETNEQLAHLLTNTRLVNSQVDDLMDAVAVAQGLGYWSGMDGGPALYQKLACDFLRRT